jgi:membrane-associated phospholipid phosphatase
VKRLSACTLLALLGWPVQAHAQDSGASPPIAPPAPGAPPAKVDQAKEQAKEAEKTPIVPSPAEPTRPAFQLYAETDLPILGVGLVFVSARLTRVQKAFCAPLCDPNDLNSLDRSTAGWWSPAWSTATDIGLYAIAAGAVTTLALDEGVLNTLNDSVVIAESGLAGMAVSSLLTLATNRPRPFLYGEKAPLADRNSPNGSFSYSSSHATVSFAIATSTFVALKRLHPKSPWPFLALGLGGGAAAFVATGRVMAGMHFISDAVGGAIVGSSMGILVPAMHGSPVKIVPVVSGTERGLGLWGSF